MQSYKNNRYFRKKQERNESGERNSGDCPTFHSRSSSGGIFGILRSDFPVPCPDLSIHHRSIVNCLPPAPIAQKGQYPLAVDDGHTGGVVCRNGMRVHLGTSFHWGGQLRIQSMGSRMGAEDAGGYRPAAICRQPLQCRGQGPCHRRKKRHTEGDCHSLQGERGFAHPGTVRAALRDNICYHKQLIINIWQLPPAMYPAFCGHHCDLRILHHCHRSRAFDRQGLPVHCTCRIRKIDTPVSQHGPIADGGIDHPADHLANVGKVRRFPAILCGNGRNRLHTTLAERLMAGKRL